MESSLYHGKLQQWRFSPLKRQFTYPVVMAFLDIDRLPELLRVPPYYSCNKWNWITYDERDHFDQPQKPSPERLREDAERNGGRPAELARQAAGSASKGGLAL